MIIRIATPKDVPDIKRLCQALFEYERASGLDDGVANMAWTETEFAGQYFAKAAAGQDGYQAFIAETDGSIVGYLIGHVGSKLFLAHNPQAELENMLVEEAFRSTGAGTKLVDAFKGWAKQQGASRLRVGAYAKNHSALEFYRKCGFHDHETQLEQSV